MPALLIGWSTVFGTPLSAERFWQTGLTSAVAFAVSMLVVLTHNFRRSDPRGRRQIKWVVYGFYISSVPLLLLWLLDLFGLATPLVTDVLSVPLTVVLPICILIAVVRYDLFDIDRVISATTSYTILAIGLLAGIFTPCRASLRRWARPSASIRHRGS